MRGGTYAEALKVGFTDEQAGFLGRLTSETRSEAIDHMEEIAEKRREEQRQENRRRTQENMRTAGLMTLGFIVGMLIAAWVEVLA